MSALLSDEVVNAGSHTRKPRFGTELIFAICRRQASQVVILDASREEAFETELVRNVITLMTVFSARLYVSRIPPLTATI